MLVKYYYLRDEKNAPRLTRCILKTEEGEVAVGTAICSKLDFPNKKVGRGIAFNRALYALKAKEDVLPIKRFKAIDVILEVDADELDYTEFGNRKNRDYKGLYDTNLLNSFEKQLIGLETE